MPPSAKARPPRLSELQTWLKAVWTRPEGIDAALASPEGRALKPWIAEAPPISARDRLAIYGDAYFSRLLESLGEDFSGTKRALGDDDFRRLIADYLAKYGSSSYNIADAGGRLAEFAAAHELRKRFRFLPDLCRLETAVLRALLTDRLPAADAAAFAALAPEDWATARLILDPTLALLEARWPVHELWLRRGEPRDESILPERACLLVVWRNDDWARVEALHEPAWRLLRKLSDGVPLAQACDAGLAPREVQSLFAGWAAGGVIKGVEL